MIAYIILIGCGLIPFIVWGIWYFLQIRKESVEYCANYDGKCKIEIFCYNIFKIPPEGTGICSGSIYRDADNFIYIESNYFADITDFSSTLFVVEKDSDNKIILYCDNKCIDIRYDNDRTPYSIAVYKIIFYNTLQFKRKFRKARKALKKSMERARKDHIIKDVLT